MLEARVVELQAQVRALRLMVNDLAGIPSKDDPYEDEAPLIVWDEER